MRETRHQLISTRKSDYPSFPPDYQFTGRRDDKVKQIGNAVPGMTAEALITSLIE